MTPERFAELHRRLSEHCQRTLFKKSTEYSKGGDRLHNFKRAALMRGVDPEYALLGMKVKHDVSIEDIVEDAQQGRLPTEDVLLEKIGDEINYQFLLFGLLMERIDAQQQKEG
jgi:hypothetical protein